MEWLPWLVAIGALLVAVRTARRCGRAEERVRILAALLDGVLAIEPSGDGDLRQTRDMERAPKAGNGGRPTP